jgi:hypothetical protein
VRNWVGGNAVQQFSLNSKNENKEYDNSPLKKVTRQIAFARRFPDDKADGRL